MNDRDSVPENAPDDAMSAQSYKSYSIVLHWTIAFLILFMIFLGWRFESHDSMSLSRANLHKSVGILILLLSLVRIGVRLVYKAPPEPPMPKWQLVSAKVLHVGFYVIMIAMPLSGWLMVSTSAREIPFFGLPWPHLPVAQDHATHEVFENIHGLIAKLIIYFMIPLHVLAALKHQLFDKDPVVQHMVPGLTPRPLLNWRWVLPLGVLLGAPLLGTLVYRGVPEKGGNAPVQSSPQAMASSGSSVVPSMASPDASASSASSPATVTTWTVDRKATKIAFSTTFSGEAINGTFNSYTADIAFDPDQLDRSHVKVSIDLTSVASGDDERDASLKSSDFFATTAFPKAVFEASKFTKKDATHYIAHGSLTMHGKTKPYELPFTLKIAGKTASMTSSSKLDRTLFGVGSGDWAKTDSVPAGVTVDITLKANAA